MEKKTGYDAVVFDMDGVIFDSERAVMQCWKELADKYQIPDIEKAVLSCTGTTMKRTREIMLEIYGEDFPYDIYAKESSAIYHSRYDGGRLPMKPGVVELLTFLKEDGKKIALASSTRRQTVTNQLKDAGILNFFDNVICGDMVEHSKPAPDIFLKACAELGVAPERAYAIEDSYNGIRAAHAGHLLPIMVPDLLPANEEMQENKMLQLDVWNVLFTIINLLILFVLMRIFLYKPVQKIIAKRQEEADRQFGEAAAKQSEAEELKTKYQAVLSDAENEKLSLIHILTLPTNSLV